MQAKSLDQAFRRRWRIRKNVDESCPVAGRQCQQLIAPRQVAAFGAAASIARCIAGMSIEVVLFDHATIVRQSEINAQTSYQDGTCRSRIRSDEWSRATGSDGHVRP